MLMPEDHFILFVFVYLFVACRSSNSDCIEESFLFVNTNIGDILSHSSDADIVVQYSGSFWIHFWGSSMSSLYVGHWASLASSWLEEIENQTLESCY